MRKKKGKKEGHTVEHSFPSPYAPGRGGVFGADALTPCVREKERTSFLIDLNKKKKGGGGTREIHN